MNAPPGTTSGTWRVDFYADGAYVGTLDETYPDDFQAGQTAHEKRAPSAGIVTNIRNADETPSPSKGDSPPKSVQ